MGDACTDVAYLFMFLRSMVVGYLADKVASTWPSVRPDRMPKEPQLFQMPSLRPVAGGGAWFHPCPTLHVQLWSRFLITRHLRTTARRDGIHLQFRRIALSCRH